MNKTGVPSKGKEGGRQLPRQQLNNGSIEHCRAYGHHRPISGDSRVRRGTAAVETGEGVRAEVSGRGLTSMDRMERN